MRYRIYVKRRTYGAEMGSPMFFFFCSLFLFFFNPFLAKSTQVCFRVCLLFCVVLVSTYSFYCSCASQMYFRFCVHWKLESSSGPSAGLTESPEKYRYSSFISVYFTHDGQLEKEPQQLLPRKITRLKTWYQLKTLVSHYRAHAPKTDHLMV